MILEQKKKKILTPAGMIMIIYWKEYLENPLKKKKKSEKLT